MSDNGMRLLQCPFCGESDELLEIEEVERVDKILYNKNGIRRNSLKIEHQVVCNNCGACGASSFMQTSDEDNLTTSMINNSMEEAALAWNARAPVNQKAFELVNDIIIKVIAENGKLK